MYKASPLLWSLSFKRRSSCAVWRLSMLRCPDSSMASRHLVRRPGSTCSNDIISFAFQALGDVKGRSMASNLTQSTVFVENQQTCLKFAHVAQLSPRIQHTYLRLRSKVKVLHIHVEPFPTTDQLADQSLKRPQLCSI